MSVICCWSFVSNDNFWQWQCHDPCHCHPWARLDIKNSVFSSRKNTQSTCKVVYSRILNRFIWVMPRKELKKVIKMFSNKSLEVIALVSAPKFHYNKAITKKKCFFFLASMRERISFTHNFRQGWWLLGLQTGQNHVYVLLCCFFLTDRAGLYHTSLIEPTGFGPVLYSSA